MLTVVNEITAVIVFFLAILVDTQVAETAIVRVYVPLNHAGDVDAVATAGRITTITFNELVIFL
tara:strand:+ start:1571 stop:1762 length:192 start_codon:yes stop_codon:yes gene_type:complete